MSTKATVSPIRTDLPSRSIARVRLEDRLNDQLARAGAINDLINALGNTEYGLSFLDSNTLPTVTTWAAEQLEGVKATIKELSL
jgi:hypothetical protein